MSVGTTTERGNFIRTADQAHIDTEALRLRSSGLTYQKVADIMETDKGTAYKRVQRALRAIPYEAVQEFRQLEGERLDALLEVAFEQATTGKRSLFAIDRCVMLMERRARLFGLDAPIRQQVEVVNYDAGSIEARVAELRSALGQLGREPIPLDGRTSEAGASPD